LEKICKVDRVLAMTEVKNTVVSEAAAEMEPILAPNRRPIQSAITPKSVVTRPAIKFVGAAPTRCVQSGGVPE
jgi:hypothetical protein